MPKKRQKVEVKINGKKCWVTGNSQQELFDNFLKKSLDSGVVTSPVHQERGMVVVSDYLEKYNSTFKSHQQSNTKINRDRIIRNHIIPEIGDMEISTVDVFVCQNWFNRLCDEGYSKETIQKIKNTISPCFDSAVFDGLISSNPFRDSRLRINSTKGEHHKALDPEVSYKIKMELPNIENDRDRRFLALLCYTGMRSEEILGLMWSDVYVGDMLIYVQRAVVHPTRNQPEIKTVKTTSSERFIPLTNELWNLLDYKDESGFILGGDRPLTYTVYRKMYNRLRETYDFADYTPHDFRDTCATEWYEAGMDISTVSKLLGHSDTSVTEKRYVKFRKKSIDEARNVMEDMT